MITAKNQRLLEIMSPQRAAGGARIIILSDITGAGIRFNGLDEHAVLRGYLLLDLGVKRE